SDEGRALRDDVEQLVRAALAGDALDPREGEPWAPLLARAEARRGAAEEDVARAARERLELEPRGRDRSAIEREFDGAAKRRGRPRGSATAHRRAPRAPPTLQGSG